MKNKIMAIILGLAAGVGALTFAADDKSPIEVLQEQVIKLQQANIKLRREKTELMTKTNTAYVTSGVCYRDEYKCMEARNDLNHSYALFSNDRISLWADCQVEWGPSGSVCQGRDYMLRTHITIHP